MPFTIPLAHDFRCKWCWVGFHQARRLQKEFGAKIDWRGFETYPRHLPFSPPKPPGSGPSRFDMLLWSEQMSMPEAPRKRETRTDYAHLAVEYAKQEGTEGALVEALYRAYWEQSKDIEDMEVLCQIAEGIVRDVTAMRMAVESRKDYEKVVHYDEQAIELGVPHVPCFFIGDQRVAEQPYQVIRKAVVEEVEKGETGIYAFLQLPLHSDRPYTVIDMVMTMDGRIVSGDRNDSVQDLGSKTDHLLMKRIESQVDAVLIGAHTLRATSPKWNPKSEKRIVVSRSGDLPSESAFLQNGDPMIVTSKSAVFDVPEGVRVLRSGAEWVDFSELMHGLRMTGVKRLLCLGGSKLNGQLISDDLVDEIFITIAPKVKLGRDLPTIAEGEPFDKGHLQQYALIEHHAVEDEVFLRYRRKR